MKVWVLKYFFSFDHVRHSLFRGWRAVYDVLGLSLCTVKCRLNFWLIEHWRDLLLIWHWGVVAATWRSCFCIAWRLNALSRVLLVSVSSILHLFALSSAFVSYRAAYSDADDWEEDDEPDCYMSKSIGFHIAALSSHSVIAAFTIVWRIVFASHLI